MKKANNIEIGLRIRLIRSELNMTQQEFSNLIGSPVSSLSNWENGRNKPKLEILKRIAEVGNIHYKVLLFGDLRSHIMNNIQYSLPKEKKHLANYISEDTLDKLVRNMSSSPDPYDLTLLEDLISEYLKTIEFDFIERIVLNTELDIPEILESIDNQDTTKLSSYAKVIAKNSELSHEKILKSLFNAADINNVNFPTSILSNKLPIKKTTLRLLRFERGQEYQVETNFKSVSNLLDLKNNLLREKTMVEYTASDNGLDLKMIDFPITYDGKKLSEDQIDKITSYIESLF